ncbi:vitelline membrane outer layer protein 1 homolog [Scylla paramamosain]|uniref:vitelline membrane outer layer protein 1 homolog n=1 Tax=Scylla paramamosain TaxID=85552 RepID=UPI003083DCE8
MLLLAVLALALAAPSLAYSPDDFIHSLGATFLGFWGATEACPVGSYARAFELKVEKQHWGVDDDTSVNAIRLYCYNAAGEPTGNVTSSTMNRGSWTGVYSCDEGDFLYGYNLKSQPDQGSLTDDTAANALRMYCRQTSDYLESPGNKWGSWLEPSFCRSGMGVCGLMTLVEEDQGTFGDDTALNDVRFLCCDLP